MNPEQESRRMRPAVQMKSKPIVLLISLLASPLALFASIDQGLLALVPAETVVLSGVDATSAKNSQFGQYLLSRMNGSDSNFQSAMEQTGFDPRRDLQSFLFAGFGPRQTQGRSKFAVLARGTFDEQRIASAAQAKNGATAQPYGGVTLYVRQTRNGGSTAFAFPDTGIAVMGDLATVQKIIDDRSTPSTLDPGLLDRVNKVGSTNDMWFASLLSGTALGTNPGLLGGKQLNTSQALKSVLQSSGGVQFGSVVQVSLDATTRSPQDAGSLSDVIRFLANMIQTQGQTNPQTVLLAKALEGMTLQTSGSDVQVSFSMPEQDLEQLAQAQSAAKPHAR
jgi:hypothetical protein